MDLNLVQADIQTALLRIRLALVASNAIVKPELTSQWNASGTKEGMPFQPETLALMKCVTALSSALSCLYSADEALQARHAALAQPIPDKEPTT